MDLLNIDIGAPAGGNETLERNLAALGRLSPEAAERVRQALPRLDAEFERTPEGALGLKLSGKTLASCRRPIAEADRLADAAEVRDNAVIALLGFGAGHHVASIARRLGQRGIVVCFEPDAALLRAVLERVDHSDWLETCRVHVLTEPDDRASILRAMAGVEGLIGLGVKVLDHPASKPRLASTAGAFADRFGEVIAALRTQVLTTLVHAETTLRNELMNADRYAASAGIDALAGWASGRAGIVVSAGPGLAHNGHLLQREGLRERAVIVAAQTALKPLLRLGVRPHFVTALDHHEISRRFYEGLTPDDVQGVTLVCEPKVNPAVPGAFPGEVRYVDSELLDQVLGGELVRPRATLPPGATVAHLSHHLARFLGCDPVVLVGQDLAFTGGVYYGAGAAIHDVWAGELGAFRTLEMLEWERVARTKRTLRVAQDSAGKPVFTDEQMASYLASFEELFSQDHALGRRVLDASEGGAMKQHADPVTLEAALDLAMEREALPAMPSAAGTVADAGAVARRLETISAQAVDVASGSRQAATLLGRMAAVHTDQRRVNELIGEVYAVRDRVMALEPTYKVVDFINQTGALRRIKADRAIELDDAADDYAKQRAQIERDRSNVEWTAEAAERVGELVSRAATVARGTGERLTRDDTTPHELRSERDDAGAIDALILVDPRFGGLWTERDLRDALPATIRRVLETGVRRCVLACDDPARIEAMLGSIAGDERVVVERVDLTATAERRRSIGAARRHAACAWRGGIGGLTVFDEAFEPTLADAVLERSDAAALLVVGADWHEVDAGLLDGCVERWRETGSRIVFTQAAPGLCGCVVDRKTVRTLADAARNGSHFASIGAVLGYIPTTPQADPIATPMCVRVERAVRDLGERRIADGGRANDLPRELVLEVCTGRLGGGLWSRWMRGGDEPVERTPLGVSLAHRVLRAFTLGRPDGAVTLHGVGDPLMHPKTLDIARMAEELGVHGLHLRTELNAEVLDEDTLLDSGIGVLSVDVLAGSGPTHAAMTGHDRLAAVEARIDQLASVARERGALGMPATWLVPRITRCARTAQEIPDFIDRWLMTCGSAAIDPGPSKDEDGSTRFRALPTPAWVAERAARDRLVVLCDGRVRGADGRAIEGIDLSRDSLEDGWRAALASRQRSAASLEAKQREQEAAVA